MQVLLYLFIKICIISNDKQQCIAPERTALLFAGYSSLPVKQETGLFALPRSTYKIEESGS